MTKKHFIRAADIVRAILQGEWTSDFPEWADGTRRVYLTQRQTESSDYTRAVQTAEAFIMLFSAQNDRFEVQKFLIACGLQEQTVR